MGCTNGGLKMDKYKKLMCVRGLIQSLQEEIYRLDTVRKEQSGQQDFDILLTTYYDAIKDFLNKEENEKSS